MAYSFFPEAKTTDMTYHLNHYYTNKVQMSREETKKAVARAVPIIQDLLRYINQVDSRFSAQMTAVGSAWTNLKVDRPNEFDVNVPISMPRLPWTSGGRSVTKYYEVDPSDRTKVRTCSTPLPAPSRGYIRKSFDSGGGEITEPSLYTPLNERETAELTRWENSEMTFQKDLVPVLVRTRFKNLLKDAVRSLSLRGIFIIKLLIIKY